MYLPITRSVPDDAARYLTVDLSELLDLAKKYTWLFLQKVVAFAALLVAGPIIFAHLGAANYSSVVLGLSLAGFITVFVQYSFNLTGPGLLVHAPSPTERSRVFWTVILAKAITATSVLLILLLASSTIVRLPDRRILPAVPLIAFATLLNSSWYFQAMEQFAVPSILAIMGSVFVILIVTMLSPLITVTAALILLLLPQMVNGFGTFIYSVTLSSNPFHCDITESYKLLREGLPVAASQWIAVIYSSVGPWVVLLFCGKAACGLYGHIERLAFGLNGMLMLIYVAAYPRFVIYVRREPLKFIQLVISSISIYLIAILFISVMLTLFGDKFITYYLKGYNSRTGVHLAWASVAWMLSTMAGSPLTALLVNTGRERVLTRVNVYMMGGCFLFGIAGCHWLGGKGWLYGTALAQILLFPALVVYLFEYWRNRDVYTS